MSKIPSIPMPQSDLHSLRETVLALKEAVETLVRQRGDVDESVVTWGELRGLKSPIDQKPLIDHAQGPRQATKR